MFPDPFFIKKMIVKEKHRIFQQNEVTGILTSYKIQEDGAKLHATTIFWQD